MSSLGGILSLRALRKKFPHVSPLFGLSKHFNDLQTQPR